MLKKKRYQIKNKENTLEIKTQTENINNFLTVENKEK
jgi:hypothetical protein